MRSGRLKHSIVIQVVSEVQNSYGEPVESWATYATRRAAIMPLRGKEYFAAKQTESDITVQFLMRYDATAGATSPKHRILWGTRVFDIESVINVDELNKEIIIVAKETT